MARVNLYQVAGVVKGAREHKSVNRLRDDIITIDRQEIFSCPDSHRLRYTRETLILHGSLLQDAALSIRII